MSKTDPLEAARRIVAAADHYLASVHEHGYKSATAEQALDCYNAAIEKDADVVARALLAREQAVAEAYRRGQKDMRERAAQRGDIWCVKNHHPNGAWGIAAAIRALPVEGER